MPVTGGEEAGTLRRARKSTAGMKTGRKWSGVQVWGAGLGLRRWGVEARDISSTRDQLPWYLSLETSLHCNQGPLSSRTIQKRNSPAFKP